MSPVTIEFEWNGSFSYLGGKIDSILIQTERHLYTLKLPFIKTQSIIVDNTEINKMTLKAVLFIKEFDQYSRDTAGRPIEYYTRDDINIPFDKSSLKEGSDFKITINNQPSRDENTIMTVITKTQPANQQKSDLEVQSLFSDKNPPNRLEQEIQYKCTIL